MVTQQEAMDRLNKEKELEEKLAMDLSIYFIDCLEEIKELKDSERQTLRQDLLKIRQDSQRHAFMFNQLLQKVLENRTDLY